MQFMEGEKETMLDSAHITVTSKASAPYKSSSMEAAVNCSTVSAVLYF
jgi:hypothetical protein